MERQVLPHHQPPVGATHAGATAELSFRAHARGRAPQHFADFDPQQRREAVVAAGMRPFRADQVARHYFGRFEADPAQMTDLGPADRERARDLLPELITPVVTQVADKGWTRKTLWRLFDGAQVESVLMRYPKRVTLCVSSQVGCGMGCPFCATGQLGLTRNLSAAEILEQVRLAAKAAQDGELGSPSRLSNLVFMGMGEPLANYKSLLHTIRTLTAEVPQGFGISARNLVVSTVGLVPGIRKLTQEGLPVTLAVSLHAPDDELRNELIPMNRRYQVDELLDTAYAYFQATGRRVSIEYALIRDMNDHPWRAQLLADKLNERGKTWAHVNPIPLNPTPGSIWDASLPRVMDEFMEILRQAGISTTLRDTRGSDIDGACGQLAAKAKQSPAA
ncbi:23S rRNA (adenine(2503)-C(2))-methyltransferase RlmN [Mobiluncus curtisii]|uniref:Probable dual-specificity RNA methyltransferase RlmN n=2 Tax=Mobiluncus curtisii TaxID=2051 RepID=D6ZGA3_MOBCV|nr:23S rRNA (adenine(2503)-C(2))-methyltransferase RlmN [Mobiluncus curtisii]ADI67661.1 23S rRNA m2A2503 methyltransferase [Mobiluncus curtisii ATCC 43063]MCU9987707.1 23S rRNA (adenine(2503)-C(2))-methyltransferase RlmN [Mobiluncus curtisii]MCV0000611.1 23S rRNA (adenine(2503)-C(2))-methyltransferase RlmN [Mobiluncus curtisii]MCV0021274.1 23S rRNA (adenine(2503)-C(2))-methyltransferase RlmN [Mobiluncus curtisii]NMW46110.1 23S rRNA (adenine(2503)-C(2))-methyltransferase RlmN [Mobiluncus curtis